MTRFLAIIQILMLSQLSYSQIGGLSTFEFLNLTQSARSTALGGYMIATNDDDINLVFSNPALLQKEMSHQLAINQNFHFAGISHGFASYGFYVEQWDMTLAFGANYIDYGTFQRADERLNILGDFGAKESSFMIGLGKTFSERLSIGTNVKFVNSTLDTYSAIGLGVDVGINYYKPENLTSWSFVLKNIGIQLNTFELQREGLPFEVQIGWSKRLEHLPFRLSITGHHLNRWNLNLDQLDNNDPIFIDQTVKERSGISAFADNFFRHLVFGGELIVGKNDLLRLRLGYNHQKNKELSTSAFRSFSGFSYGFGLKVKKIRFDYAIATYHLAGSVNHVSILIDMNSLFSKI